MARLLGDQAEIVEGRRMGGSLRQNLLIDPIGKPKIPLFVALKRRLDPTIEFIGRQFLWRTHHGL
jgi:hypothetical protein